LKKILIFTAGFGEGHNTAARNIQAGIEFLEEEEAHVEVIDLFDSCYGKFNDFVRKAYLNAINNTPLIWQGIYAMLDHTNLVEKNLAALTRLRQALDQLLHESQPDVVISTYPVYNYLIEEIYRERPRHFTQVTVVTDSISVNSLWYRSTSDYYLVPNEETAEVFRGVGIKDDKLRVLGFPVQLAFIHQQDLAPLPDLAHGGRPRVLYLINSGKKKAPKVIEQLLSHPNWDLTIAVGRDVKFQKEITALVQGQEARVTVLGWTSKVPELMMTHHAVISKAGGATVQEAIAACIPMIVNQVVPGQEEGNYELLKRINAGALAQKSKDIESWLDRAFADGGQLCTLWRQNLQKVSKPDSTLQIARFILEQAIPENVPPREFGGFKRSAERRAAARKNLPNISPREKKLLLCDFHTHTTYSDGKLTVSEIVDFYGQRGFDALCITDHLIDPAKLIGQMVQLSGMVLSPQQVPEYFETIEKEKKRAWKKYDLMLFTGIEFNKDGYRAKSSAHLLGIDLTAPINPTLSLKEIIGEIHAQGGLAVASHPHKFQTAWGKNTLYLWEQQAEYAPLLDAWEVANRDDLFTPVGLKRLPFLANSDFHKPKHIESWKTLLFCEKEREAIKQCIRLNRDVALTLYRDQKFAANIQPASQSQHPHPHPSLIHFPPVAA
jgi:processive 1,2-diacylglycerol beta-glucosyltransferase